MGVKSDSLLVENKLKAFGNKVLKKISDLR
jgi:hypothetical protein